MLAYADEVEGKRGFSCLSRRSLTDGAGLPNSWMLDARKRHGMESHVW